MSTEISLLKITPDSEITFELSSSEDSARCQVDLVHNSNSGKAVSFKIKTTQPRRYLVRPNQGLIEPGSSQQIQIILVDKDKNALLQQYRQLGKVSLDQSKDKFLVQSCTVDPSQVQNLANYDQLTLFWSSVSASTGDMVYNKKMHVRLLVAPADQLPGDPASPRGLDGTSNNTANNSNNTSNNHHAPIENMSKEELVVEVQHLRRKYDELVAFSVNLTAERDILNNTLEQTKRDLNRELAKHLGGDAARRQAGNAGRGGMQAAAKNAAGGLSWTTLLALAALCFLAGVRMHMMGQTGFLQKIPLLGVYFHSV